MSLDIDWHALTEGAQGEALAESIRAFLHDRFQRIPLPRLIRSVKVVSFEFGSVAPEIELKDVCDPLPDFYDSDDDDDISDASPTQPSAPSASQPLVSQQSSQQRPDQSNQQSSQQPVQQRQRPSLADLRLDTLTSRHNSIVASGENASPLLASRVASPGIPGGTSNLNYFHMPLGLGLSGSSTPLAALSGGHHQLSHGWPSSASLALQQEAFQFPNRTNSPFKDDARLATVAEKTLPPPESDEQDQTNPSDVQIVGHLKYSGDVKLSLTADILLDFPMPSFVGLPVNLNVTGMSFDGVAIVAYIKRKIHFCFLAPEDANAFIGNETSSAGSSRRGSEAGETTRIKPVGGLFEQIHVESEIGERHDNTKQVLKNVGTVERFILEQVTKIFETELVYPSFWTFLV